ncbi:MAG: sugar transferase [Chloroflexaceae bacterium]|nr:sugar transferase [Chloroflexaceae bacterium]NJO04635.1 sugar transferase [Chloroflexaceae bacterium]
MIERISRRLANSILFWNVFLTLLCLYLTSHIRLWLPFGNDLVAWQVHWPFTMYLGVALIWVVVFLLLIPQRAIFTETLVEALGRLFGAVALSGLSFAGMLYLSPFRQFSRLQFVYFVLFNLVVLLILHLAVRAYVRSWLSTHSHRRLLIVGTDLLGEQLAQEFQRRPWAGMRVVGYTGDYPPPQSTLPVFGSVADTVRVVKEQQIDEVVFALPVEQQAQMVSLSLQLQRYPVMVHTVPGLLDLAFARTSMGTLGGIPLISLRESALTESQRMLKRAFDVVTSMLVLTLCSPLLLLIALVIRFESPGSIFFLQERIGEHGKRFKMIKFRTMYQDAEKRWHEVALRDEQGRLIHKVKGDPRITPFGRWLRRTSLDELPQLFNVIKGEMSLVGPRPEMPYIVDEYESWQWQRFRVPPGITGWWQVNGRSDKPMHLHTEDDLYYVQNYSFWLDLQILLKTIAVVWRGQGAF